MERLQISIPKACHEDWNQMTPGERGRFCSMCKKTVLDFSEKTDEEILDFISAHRNENLCGRFRTDQLEHDFSRIELPLPVYRSPLSFLNAFLVALLFCFGTTLFSCNVPAKPPTPAVVGAMVTEIPVENIPDTVASKSIFIQEDFKGEVMGDIWIPPVSAPEKKVCTKGKIAFEPDTTVNLDTVEIADSMRVATMHSLGMMIVRTHDVPDTSFTETDSAMAKEFVQSNNSGNVFTSVYPNPSGGLVNVKFQPTEEQNVQMDLYDLSGRLIRNLVPTQLMPAEIRTMQLDVSDQPPGIYFIRIAAGNNVKTERVVIEGR